MSSERLPDFDRPAFDLLLSIVETPAGVISGEALDGYFAAAAVVLKEHGLLECAGHVAATASRAGHDDEPIHLHWSDEHGGYGYFSPAVGWVTVPSSQLTSYRVRLVELIQHVGGRLEQSSQHSPLVLVPDMLWEVGDVRLPGRTKRVPVWIARRLSDPAVWQQFAGAARRRPAPGLRMVLSFTAADRLPAHMLDGHEIISIRDVADATGLAVDPNLLAARLNPIVQSSDEPITMAADGAALVVRGKRYSFRGSKQRDLIRQLYEAWQSGRPECLTAQVLEHAGYSRTVNTLAKAFSGRRDWREFITEEGGSCWMFC